MENCSRKIQKIAGTTYSISLPKNWIKEMGLDSGDELNISEAKDKSLIIYPGKVRESESLNFKISIDKYSSELRQILYFLYYHGFREIELFSSSEISFDVKRMIREVILDLSGAEIIYEDKKMVKIKVMLKDINIDLFQVFYRINLLIDSSIENLIEGMNWGEIKFNEDEIDRLYNLGFKIITTSLTDRNILNSSGIKNLKLIPSLFLINKRLENIGDNIKKMAKLAKNENIKLKSSVGILNDIRKHLNYSFLFLMNGKGKKYNLFFQADIESEIKKINNDVIKTWVVEVVKYLLNIQEEIISINFHRELMKK